MEKNKVRVGILGCARIAERYAVRAFQSIENAEVVSIASREPKKAEAWASRFGISAERSYDLLIENPNIDAVYIPLPIGLHKEWIIKAVEAGKHVISEKSLASSLGDVQEIVRAAKKNGAVLYENFMCGFHPQTIAALNLVKEGKIGKPFLFRGYFGFPMMSEDNIRYKKELGGGALNDAGAYTVFMARKFFGEPRSVSAALFVGKKRGVDMKGAVLLEFKDERSAVLGFSFDSVYQNNYSVWGGSGFLNNDRAYSIPPEMKPVVGIMTNDGKNDKIHMLDLPPANHFELIFKDFCETVLDKKRSSKKIEEIYKDILNQAKVLEAIRQSAAQNKKIFLADF